MNVKIVAYIVYGILRVNAWIDVFAFQSTSVLDALLKNQITTAKSIMAVDKSMTEAQQKTEGEIVTEAL